MLPAEELVRRCREAHPGDLRAFELLVRQYQERVFATAYRLMGNRQDAEDVAQEVFLKVHRGIHALEEPATLTAWIYRITTNLCLDALTRQKRRPRTVSLTPPSRAGNEPVEPPYADLRTPTPEEAVLRSELHHCLETALVQLDPTTRTMLVLRDVEGRAYQEIAESLLLGLSAVKMRIHRARLLFQQMLERVCPETVPANRAAPTGAPR
jgi:RNA polymerase sigma-70 factor (ECF subfamily)